jgi:hypothetical protein
VKQQYSAWRKSSHSNPSTECVEVGRSAHGTIAVRDTKHNGRGPILEFTSSEWTEFLRLIRS